MTGCIIEEGAENVEIEEEVKNISEEQNLTGEQVPRSVTITSNENVYTGISNHHSFRFPDGSVAGGGGHIGVNEIADELIPIMIGGDFQIMIQGEQHYPLAGYSFVKLIDGEWMPILVVETGNPDKFFLTHGPTSREEWEQVYTESLFELLEPGEYILLVMVSWGNAESGVSGQYFFRLIK